jgi:FMN phosphatase YigB (HAD superfamily)
VGDFYHIDVAGARAAGITAVLFDVGRLYEWVDCPRVNSLTAFADWLEREMGRG